MLSHVLSHSLLVTTCSRKVFLKSGQLLILYSKILVYHILQPLHSELGERLYNLSQELASQAHMSFETGEVLQRITPSSYLEILGGMKWLGTRAFLRLWENGKLSLSSSMLQKLCGSSKSSFSLTWGLEVVGMGMFDFWHVLSSSYEALNYLFHLTLSLGQNYSRTRNRVNNQIRWDRKRWCRVWPNHAIFIICPKCLYLEQYSGFLS